MDLKEHYTLMLLHVSFPVFLHFESLSSTRNSAPTWVSMCPLLPQVISRVTKDHACNFPSEQKELPKLMASFMG